MNEIANMKAYPHPLIVKLLDEFINSNGNKCLVLELYQDRDFKKYLGDRQGENFSEPEILRFLANIILAVFHINSRDIFHRDLKPDNLLIKKRNEDGKIHLYLSDFGFAKNIKDMDATQSTASNIKGTPLYLSPEAH